MVKKVLAGIIIILLIVIIYLIYRNPSVVVNQYEKNRIIKIKELRNDLSYFNKEIQIEGYVTKVIDIPFISDDFYRITDGTGEIWILSNSGIPPIRSHVVVEGIYTNIGKNFEYLGISLQGISQKSIDIN